MSHTTETLANALGRKVIANAVGVGLTAVSNGVVRGRFPASWYQGIKQECDRQGVQCPMDLFDFKTGSEK